LHTVLHLDTASYHRCALLSPAACRTRTYSSCTGMHHLSLLGHPVPLPSGLLPAFRTYCHILHFLGSPHCWTRALDTSFARFAHLVRYFGLLPRFRSYTGLPGLRSLCTPVYFALARLLLVHDPAYTVSRCCTVSRTRLRPTHGTATRWTHVPPHTRDIPHAFVATRLCTCRCGYGSYYHTPSRLDGLLDFPLRARSFCTLPRTFAYPCGFHATYAYTARILRFIWFIATPFGFTVTYLLPTGSFATAFTGPGLRLHARLRITDTVATHAVFFACTTTVWLLHRWFGCRFLRHVSPVLVSRVPLNGFAYQLRFNFLVPHPRPAHTAFVLPHTVSFHAAPPTTVTACCSSRFTPHVRTFSSGLPATVLSV